jgi:hypothetical protein
MSYLSDLEILVFSDLNFISTVVNSFKVHVTYNLEALFDEVSAEVLPLFVAQRPLQLALQAQVVSEL